MMKQILRSRRPRAILLAILCGPLAFTSGCASIFDGTHQSVRVRTRPGGHVVYYLGEPVSDGEKVRIGKKFEASEFRIGSATSAETVRLDYSPAPWLLGDAGLLLFGVVPGLVAFGIDAATGAWRNLDDEQVVYVPEALVTRAASPPSDAESTVAKNETTASAKTAVRTESTAEKTDSEAPPARPAGHETPVTETLRHSIAP